ncbi:hypothetical protein ACFL2F_03830, partial [Myxococcota bacterium]
KKSFFLGLTAALAMLTTAVQAGPGIDAKKLIGKWEGELTLSFTLEGETMSDKSKITMEFRKDGKLITTEEEGKDKSEDTYEIKNNQIYIIDHGSSEPKEKGFLHSAPTSES